MLKLRAGCRDLKEEYGMLYMADHLDAVGDIRDMIARDRRMAAIADKVGESLADEWDREFQKELEKIPVYCTCECYRRDNGFA
jgi:hypothetical protein